MSFTLREAVPGDVAALAALHVQTFNETHCGGRPNGPTFAVRERQWREKLNDRDPGSFTFVVENESAELIGFARGQTSGPDDPAEFKGILNKIYVLQRYHRQGIGRELLYHIAKRFVDRGTNSMILFGVAANPSNAFYEAFGAERLFAPNGEFHGGYGWRDLRALCTRLKGS